MTLKTMPERLQRVLQAAAALLMVFAFILLLTQPADASEPGAADEAPVGTVSLLLGKAWLESGDGERRAVSVGDDIRASDRIVTESNGHVHVQFIDEGLVSVRPGSRLRITEYDYNEQSPSDSTVKFALEEGVTRSISGKAGSAARERFRLDTPVAAIGVRGTDFVVSASQRNVRALVNEGAIVIAPYSESCLAGTLGPCATGSLELASASMQIAEVVEGQMEPVLRPRAEQQLLAMVDSELEEERDDEEGSAMAKEAIADVYQESVALREVNERASEQPATRPTSAAPSAIETTSLEQRQLVWGRFAMGEPGRGIALSWADAREGRKVTVGNGEVALYRNDVGTTRVESGLGEIGFDLDAAQAFHNGSAGTEAMTVNGGGLRIDFGRDTFTTSLNLDSDATGAIDFNSSGQLFSGGVFHNRSDDKNIAGSVSIDGREAGYFFDQQLGSGTIRGTTLWSAGE
ncbi:MAG: FecR family protein [Pseudohongiellaceae bacterium]